MEVAAYITAIATAVLALLTWLNVRVTSQLVRAQFDPRVEVAFQQLQSQDNVFGVVLTNRGSGPAYNVKTSVKFADCPVNVPQYLQEVTRFFNHEWPVVNPGEMISKLIEMDVANEARESGIRVCVDAEYSSSPGRGRWFRTQHLITPYWQDGTFLGPPGVWREVDSRVGELINAYSQHSASITRAITGLAGKQK